VIYLGTNTPSGNSLILVVFFASSKPTQHRRTLPLSSRAAPIQGSDITMKITGTMIKAAFIGTAIGLLVILVAESSFDRKLPDPPLAISASGTC
jgi:hypothetical protein